MFLAGLEPVEVAVGIRDVVASPPPAAWLRQAKSIR